ncbi:hypothetical protein VTN77DRAFT_6843 [Rasamsonia byssochlamydoides]|uniref:uncharacterized protein n=1 Tax=Rasamsonia byssochlamydoides TaxID=89139 RepID=UPI003742455F
MSDTEVHPATATATGPVASSQQQEVILNSSFYREELDEVEDPARTLLEKYSGIAPEKVVQHVKEVRDRAYAVFPYPCIGLFAFLDLDLPLSPCYHEIVERTKKGDKFLDLACCFGQEIRQLAHEGVPHTNIYGSDLSADFINLGYDLFLDKDTLSARFIAADIFDDNSELVRQLPNQIDIIHASNFFHLFDWNTQVDVAKRVVKLLRPRPGSLIVGSQAGNTTPKEYIWGQENKAIFLHDATTWQELWEQVGRETGLRFKVDAVQGEYRDREVFQIANREGVFRFLFTVRLE